MSTKPPSAEPLDDLICKVYWAVEHGSAGHARRLVTEYRKDTLLNELRALLVNYTPEQRVDMFGMLIEGYCIHCGAVSPCQDCPRHLPFTPASTTV